MRFHRRRQSGSLVSRGLDAVKRQTLLSAKSEADAEKLRDAKDAYGRGNFAEAAKWFLRAAEQGDAVAQFYLGAMYNKGARRLR